MIILILCLVSRDQQIPLYSSTRSAPFICCTYEVLPSNYSRMENTAKLRFRISFLQLFSSVAIDMVCYLIYTIFYCTKDVNIKGCCIHYHCISHG